MGGHYRVMYLGAHLSEQNPEQTVRSQTHLDVLDREQNERSHHADIQHLVQNGNMT